YPGIPAVYGENLYQPGLEAARLCPRTRADPVGVDWGRDARGGTPWHLGRPGDVHPLVMRSYRRGRWELQPHRVEVWSEKGTVRGTLAPVLARYGSAFRVMHGHGSATALHEAAEESQADGTPRIILYRGDWDPSGMHMSQIDIPERLARYRGAAEVTRVALAGDEVD